MIDSGSSSGIATGDARGSGLFPPGNSCVGALRGSDSGGSSDRARAKNTATGPFREGAAPWLYGINPRLRVCCGLCSICGRKAGGRYIPG